MHECSRRRTYVRTHCTYFQPAAIVRERWFGSAGPFRGCPLSRLDRHKQTASCPRGGTGKYCCAAGRAGTQQRTIPTYHEYISRTSGSRCFGSTNWYTLLHSSVWLFKAGGHACVRACVNLLADVCARARARARVCVCVRAYGGSIWTRNIAFSSKRFCSTLVHAYERPAAEPSHSAAGAALPGGRISESGATPGSSMGVHNPRWQGRCAQPTR